MKTMIKSGAIIATPEAIETLQAHLDRLGWSTEGKVSGYDAADEDGWLCVMDDCGGSPVARDYEIAIAKLSSGCSQEDLWAALNCIDPHDYYLRILEWIEGGYQAKIGDNNIELTCGEDSLIFEAPREWAELMFRQYLAV